MLSKILKEFKKTEGPLNLNELGRRLDIERSALEGMLQLLVRKGRLREIGLGTDTCVHCAGHLSCAQLQMGNLTGKAYELVD
jgi:hypothetical protein